jgi:hypothetical protein
MPDDFCGEWKQKCQNPLDCESERTISIWEWYKQGISLSEIRTRAIVELPGCRSITKERVRQIIARIERKSSKTALDNALPE